MNLLYHLEYVNQIFKWQYRVEGDNWSPKSDDSCPYLNRGRSSDILNMEHSGFVTVAQKHSTEQHQSRFL